MQVFILKVLRCLPQPLRWRGFAAAQNLIAHPDLAEGKATISQNLMLIVMVLI
jgi:hypothetical protein